MKEMLYYYPLQQVHMMNLVDMKKEEEFLNRLLMNGVHSQRSL